LKIQGNLLYCTSGSKILCLDLRTQKVVWEKLQKKLMMFVDVDSTKIVSGGYDNNVHVWYLNHFHGTDSKKKEYSNTRIVVDSFKCL
jgi:hypothetical protein